MLQSLESFSILPISVLAIVLSFVWIFAHFRQSESQQKTNSIKPISVNYHFTRRCNYTCGFCFHTAKTSFMLEEEDAKRGLRMLKEAGMRKINFAGGEPFLYPEFLGAMVKYCKEDLAMESISVVTNASKAKRSWFESFGKYVDVLAVSCDSFNEDVNAKIGRGKGKHLETMRQFREWCQEFGVVFKINTVVCSMNFHEDMREQIKQLNPKRWKVFQVLKIDTENSGENAKRNVDEFLISSEQFKSFVDRHAELECLVPESNEAMRNSYLILDEYMRFLNCQGGNKEPSESLLTVGVEAAIARSGFDQTEFINRKGIYQWSRAAAASFFSTAAPGGSSSNAPCASSTATSGGGCSSQNAKSLQW